MIFSYNLLQTFFKQKLPDAKKLADLIGQHVFEIEGLEKIGNDWAITIDILPNRGDCFSHLGLAKEISAILGYALLMPSIKYKENQKILANNFLKVRVLDKDCQRYTAKVVKNIKVSEGNKKIKQYLETCGLNSINNIVDIANFVMIELGQPLHVFDLDKIEKQSITVKSLIAKEKFLALDDKTYELNVGDMVIASPSKTLALAGVKGGKFAEVDNNTKDVVIESANFLYSRIRKTTTRIDLKTDASIRFEHKLDPELTILAINRFASLLDNGDIAKGVIDIYSKKPAPKLVKLEIAKIESVLGAKIPLKNILAVLKSLGFMIAKSNKDSLFVKIPTYRLDICFQEDLIEEIGRIYGYEKISVQTPISAIATPSIDNDILWANRARIALSSIGFFEAQNYSFVSQKNKDDLGLLDSDLIEILNPLSSEQQYLRPNLLINLLKNVKNNLAYYSDIKLFEIGNIFNKDEYKDKIYDVINLRLSGVIAHKTDKDMFYEAKGVVDYLLSSMGIADYFYKDIDLKSNIWKRNAMAKIELNGIDIGYVGVPQKMILDKMGINCQDVAIFDFDFAKLSDLATQEYEYQEIPKYPAIIRDISILVPFNAKIDDVLQRIDDVKSDLIEDVDLFDIFEKDGNKSLAFHIIFQAKDRTLTGQEIDPIMQKIIEILSKNKDWKPRI